jgi:K(+)-stimulated pyrophosphate-energized sodium pump
VVFLAKGVAGTYGIALAAVGALSVTGMILAAEGFGLVNESAAWIARLTGLPNEVKNITDKLEAVGKRALTAGKGFSSGTAALTVAALLFAYATQSGLTESNLLTARTVIGLLIGSSVPFILSSLLLHTLGKNYDRTDEEKEKELASDEDIMRIVCSADEQVREQRGILSKTAMQETVVPVLLTIAAPFVIGILFGSQALAGFLTGAFCTGLLVVVICGNAGSLFGAVKKYIEADHYGGKGGESHRAVLIGAHFGDVLNTVIGPSVNALIKVMVIEALLFAPVFHAVGGLF